MCFRNSPKNFIKITSIFQKNTNSVKTMTKKIFVKKKLIKTNFNPK